MLVRLNLQAKKQIVGKLFEWVRILKFAVQIANIS